MKIQTVTPTATIDATTGVRPFVPIVIEQTHRFYANLQKQLLSEYERKSKIKSEAYVQFLPNKKALITIIFGQCDEATKTKIALKATYAANRQAGNLIKFIKQLHIVCFGSDDGDLSYGPYKQVVTIKLMNNYANNEPYNSHGFK